jgi:ADP-ribosylglycohydrolase
VLLDASGREISYRRDGRAPVTNCFGGAPAAATALVRRPWQTVFDAPKRPKKVSLHWPRKTDEALDRAIGCLLGQVIGDSLGSLVEFQSPDAIAKWHPEGVRELADGGVWNTLAGQPTDDSELALALARCLVARGGYDEEAAAEAYGDWYASHPFDMGGTTRAALGAAARAPVGGKAEAARGAANRTSQANGSLMRVAPIGIAAGTPERAAEWAMRDSTLSHPHPACAVACAAYAAAIATGVLGGSREEMLASACMVAGDDRADGSRILEVLRAAAAGTRPTDYLHQMGWVVIALQNAFYHLAHTSEVEATLVETVGKGGDTDTNGAIVGALLGAAEGRSAFPRRWVLPILACRPHAELDAGQPRPDIYWPDDLAELAEALVRLRPPP